jgi:hypothetical protein
MESSAVSLHSPQHPVLEHPQSVFFPECEGPSFTPTWNNRWNYSFVYFNPIPRPCVTFRNKLVFYNEELLALAQTSWRTTPYRPSDIANSIHSHLPSTPKGRILQPQSDDAPWRGDRDPQISYLMTLFPLVLPLPTCQHID